MSGKSGCSTQPRKKSLVKKLNNGTSLPLSTVFHFDKCKHFVCYLLRWCKAAMEQNHFFVILAAPEVCTVAASSRDARGPISIAEQSNFPSSPSLRSCDKQGTEVPDTLITFQGGKSHNKHKYINGPEYIVPFFLTNGKVNSCFSFQVGM